MLNDYIMPASIPECLEYLKSYNGEARVIAGGTDLILQQREKQIQAKCLIDISMIEELKFLEEKEGVIFIGAGVTHAEVASSQLIRSKASLLTDASDSVGSPQIRNVATVVGNVVNAQPAADAAIALIALEAKADIITYNGKMTLPLEDLYIGLNKSKVDSSKEIVTSVHFKSLSEKQGSSFMRVAPRNALSLPVLNIAMVITIKDQLIDKANIVLGPVADRPYRAVEAENLLEGSRIDSDEIIGEAASCASGECSPRDSFLRGTTAYRRELIKVLVKRAYMHAKNDYMMKR